MRWLAPHSFGVVVLLYKSFVCILRFSCHSSVMSDAASSDKLFQYVLQWHYSVCPWSIAILLTKILYSSANSDIFRNLLHWKLSYYPCVIFFGSVSNSAIIFVLHITFFVCFVIAFCFVGCGHHSFFGEGILDANLINHDGIQGCRYHYKWTDCLQQKFHQRCFGHVCRFRYLLQWSVSKDMLPVLELWCRLDSPVKVALVAGKCRHEFCIHLLLWEV